MTILVFTEIRKGLYNSGHIIVDKCKILNARNPMKLKKMSGFINTGYFFWLWFNPIQCGYNSHWELGGLHTTWSILLGCEMYELRQSNLLNSYYMAGCF